MEDVLEASSVEQGLSEPQQATAPPPERVLQMGKLITAGYAYQKNHDCDVFVYAGPIERRGYDILCKRFGAHASPRKNATLLLSTFGGDPHAAFRIARAISHRYPDGDIRVLVPSWCKSAGTLICIGANELVLGDSSELGPLDVQVQKPDEMIGRISGLDILRGMESLKDGLLSSFRQFLVDINAGTGISTKSAADVATKLAIGIYEPILGQVDPMRLGEMEAALQIAFEYGSRLDDRFENLKANALIKLVHGYPSHSFVIDRKEAKSLFKRVRRPSDQEATIAHALMDMVSAIRQPASVEVLALDDMIRILSERFPALDPMKGNSDESSQHGPSAQEGKPESDDSDEAGEAVLQPGQADEPDAASIGSHPGPDAPESPPLGE